MSSMQLLTTIAIAVNNWMFYIFSIISPMLIAVILALPVWWLSRKQVRWKKWEYLIPPVVVGLQMLLIIYGRTKIGNDVSSSSAIVEVFLGAWITLLGLAFRISWPGHTKKDVRTSIAISLLLPLLLILILRTIMPAVPDPLPTV